MTGMVYQLHILGWVPVGGLSECCLTPSLIRVTWAISPSTLGSFVMCADCQQRFSGVVSVPDSTMENQ